MDNDIFIAAFFDEMEKIAINLNIRARAQAAKQKVLSGIKSRAQSAQRASTRLSTPRHKKRLREFGKEVEQGVTSVGRKVEPIARRVEKAGKEWGAHGPAVVKDYGRAASAVARRKVIRPLKRQLVPKGEGGSRVKGTLQKSPMVQKVVKPAAKKVKEIAKEEVGPGLKHWWKDSDKTPMERNPQPGDIFESKSRLAGRKVTTHYGEGGKQTHVLETKGHSDPKVTTGERPPVGPIGIVAQGLRQRKAAKAAASLSKKKTPKPLELVR